MLYNLIHLRHYTLYYYINQTKPGQGFLWCCVALVVFLVSTPWCHLTTGTGCCGVAEMFTQGWHTCHSLRPYPWHWEKMAPSTKRPWVSAWVNLLLSGSVFSGSDLFWTEAMGLILPFHRWLCPQATLWPLGCVTSCGGEAHGVCSFPVPVQPLSRQQ